VQRKLEQYSFENHSRQCSGDRADLQKKRCWFKFSCWHFFFLEIIPFGHTFLLSISKTAVTQHPSHLWRQDLRKIKCPSSGNSNIVVVYRYVLLSIVEGTIAEFHLECISLFCFLLKTNTTTDDVMCHSYLFMITIHKAT